MAKLINKRRIVLGIGYPKECSLIISSEPNESGPTSIGLFYRRRKNVGDEVILKKPPKGKKCRLVLEEL